MIDVGGYETAYWRYSPETSTTIVLTYLHETGVPQWLIRLLRRFMRHAHLLRFTPSIRADDAKLDWSVHSEGVVVASSHEPPGGDDSIRCPPIC